MNTQDRSPSGLRRWLEQRWPLAPMLRLALDEDIPCGPRVAYVLGSATLFLFLLQAVTGIWQLFYYVPTVDHAYESVLYLRLYVAFGWLVHGLHYWGANAFMVVMTLHAARVFLWGAYKQPRELTWLAGVALLVLGLGMMFSGAILPWDELGYWAGEVGADIAASVPLVGEFLGLLLRGDNTLAQLALSRAYVLHVAILPGLAAALIVVHLVAFRQTGSAGPWDPEKRKRPGRFWPDQVFRDVVMAASLLVVLVALCAYVPAPITGPADPQDSSYVPKPEWTFLFLYQALKVFKGPWEPVGSVGVPLVLVLLLVLLPFLDRSEERAPAKRRGVIACGIILAAAVISLGLAGYLSQPPSGPPAAAPNLPAPAAAAKPAEPPPAASPEAVKAGGQLFDAKGCAACHSVNGKGGELGPDLSGESQRGRARPWLIAHIRDANAHNPNTIMPPYPGLTDKQVSDMVDYLMSLSATTAAAPPKPPPSQEEREPGPAARMIGSPDHGRLLYVQYCQGCHGVDGDNGIDNPGADAGKIPPLRHIARKFISEDPATFARNVDLSIQFGSRPAGPNPAMSMPGFGATASLSQPQIANLEAYILNLNGVDRAQIMNPGVDPPLFLLLTSAAFALAGLIMTGAWLRLRKRNPATRP